MVRVLVGMIVTATLSFPGITAAQGGGDSSHQSDSTEAAAPQDLFRTEHVGPKTWRLNVTGPGSIRVAVQGRTAPADVLRVYGPDGSVFAETTSPGLADEEVVFTVPAAATFQIRLEPADGGSAADLLTLRVAGSLVPGESAPALEPFAMPALVGPDAVFSSPPSLSIVNVTPAVGSLLREPLCGLFESAGASKQCPSNAVSVLGADVAFDTGGRTGLFVIGLLDAGTSPMPIGMDLDAGAGRDSITSIQTVSGAGTVHLTTSTTKPYETAGATVTRWRVRLCDVPHLGPGGWQFGPCYREATSGDYPLAPLAAGTTMTPPPFRAAPDAVMVEPVVGQPSSEGMAGDATAPDQDGGAP